MRDLSAICGARTFALSCAIPVSCCSVKAPGRYSTLAKGVYRSFEKCEDVRNDNYKHVIYYITPKIFKYLVK